jgi:hypothetical protein
VRAHRSRAVQKSRAALRSEQLEHRWLLSVNDLVWNGTSGADQVLFEQLDATTIRVTETLLDGVAVNNVTVHTGIDGPVIASGVGGNDLLDASGLTTTQSTLGGVLVDEKKYGEAEPLLTNSYEAIAQAPGSTARVRDPALERVIALYEQWGRPDVAATWRQKR